MAKSSTQQPTGPSKKKRAADDDIAPATKRVTRSMSKSLTSKCGTTCSSPVEQQTPSSTSKGFLSLPPEIRNKIYYFVALHEFKGLTKVSPKDAALWGIQIQEINSLIKSTNASLLETCSQIRQEALGFFYSDQSFEITPEDWTGDLCHRFFRFIKKYDFKSVRVTVQPDYAMKSWPEMLEWLEKCHAGQSWSPSLQYYRYEDPYCGFSKAEDVKVVKTFRYVVKHQHLPWEDVKAGLKEYRNDLAIHGVWDTDHRGELEYDELMGEFVIPGTGLELFRIRRESLRLEASKPLQTFWFVISA